MQDVVRQVLDILRGMWAFRWLALLVSWVVAAVAFVVVLKIPNQYEASARIYVDTQSILKPLMSGLTVQPNVEQQISMLSRTLISRPNIEKLVRMADLDLNTDTKLDQEQLIEALTKSIQIRNTGRDNLYSLAYRDSQQEKAKRVIQALVSIFVESSLGASRKDTDSAKTFLNDQIRQYEAKLEEAETRLKEFRLKNIDLQLAEGKDSTGRVTELATQLQAAQLELREAENAREAVKQQLAVPGKGGLGLPSEKAPAAEVELPIALPEIDGRLADLRRSLDAAQQRYTEQHPDIVIIKRQIAELEAQRTKESAELRKKMAAQAKTENPNDAQGLINQELNRMLAGSEVKVAALKARVAEFQARLAQARESLKTAPQIEAEAAQLNRDYDILKRNYQDLVSRRQSAIMSGELEVASGVADFRLIDPPRVTPEPVAPNRILLLLGGLGAAVGAGIVVSFLAAQIRPVFRDADQLRNVTGLPLLGVVSLVVDDTFRRRERVRLLQFLGASGGLVGLYGLGLVAIALLGQRLAG